MKDKDRQVEKSKDSEPEYSPGQNPSGVGCLPDSAPSVLVLAGFLTTAEGTHREVPWSCHQVGVSFRAAFLPMAAATSA